MRHGGDKRGSAAARRARKHWMLTTFGNGHECACVHCQARLTFATVEADRIIPGGSYRRENVAPACRRCNARRGTRPMPAAVLASVRDLSSFATA